MGGGEGIVTPLLAVLCSCVTHPQAVRHTHTYTHTRARTRAHTCITPPPPITADRQRGPPVPDPVWHHCRLLAPGRHVGGCGEEDRSHWQPNPRGCARATVLALGAGAGGPGGVVGYWGGGRGSPCLWCRPGWHRLVWGNRVLEFKPKPLHPPCRATCLCTHQP